MSSSSPSQLANLPSALCSACFSFLPVTDFVRNVTLVSRHFHDIADQPSSVRVLKLSGLNLEFDPEYLARFGCVDALDLEECSMNAEDLQSLLSALPKLRSLSLFNAAIHAPSDWEDDRDLRWWKPIHEQLGRMPLLKLNLTDCDLDHRLISALLLNESDPSGLSVAARSIRTLAFAYCEGFGDAELLLAVKNLPKLEQLNISYIPGLTAASAAILADDVASSSLQTLMLAGLSFVDGNWMQTAFGSRSKVMTTMTHASVSFEACSNLRDVDVIRFAEAMNDRVLELDVSGNPQLTDAAFSDGIAMFCPHLRWLNVSGCDVLTDVSIRAVLRHCHQLSELTMENCLGIRFELNETADDDDDDDDDSDGDEKMKFATASARLEAANAVSSTSSTSSSSSDHLPSQSITLTRARSLDDEESESSSPSSSSSDMMLNPYGGASASDFKTLEIFSSSLTSLHGLQSGLSVLSLLTLARSCPKLQKLDLRECRRASMSSASTLPKIGFWKFLLHPTFSLRNVTELYLSRAAALDDAFLILVIRKFGHQLTTLVLTQFPSFSVNDSVVNEIALQSGSSLRKLWLSDCPGVTDVGIAALTNCQAVLEFRSSASKSESSSETSSSTYVSSTSIPNPAKAASDVPLSLCELNVTGCEKVTAASALGLLVATGKCHSTWSRIMRAKYDDDEVYGYDDDDDGDYDADDETRDVGLDALFESLADAEVQSSGLSSSSASSSSSQSPRMPYLTAVKVKMSGMGSWGTKLLRKAQLLQEYDVYQHHFTNKFY